MIWQDVVLGAGSVLLALALWPSVVRHDPPARSTCFLTCIVLATFALTMLTLHLWFSAVTTGVTAWLWAVLHHQALQKEALWKDHKRHTELWNSHVVTKDQLEAMRRHGGGMGDDGIEVGW